MRDWLKRFVRWWAERLGEKSTWAGVTLLSASSAHRLPPEVLDAVSFWGPMIATGLIAASTKKDRE